MNMQRPPEPIRNYTAALIQSAAQLNTIIEQMSRFSEEHPQPRSKPIVVVLTDLVEGILTDRTAGIHPADLKKATEILIAATDGIGNDLFFVDPGLIDDQGNPDLN